MSSLVQRSMALESEAMALLVLALVVIAPLEDLEENGRFAGVVVRLSSVVTLGQHAHLVVTLVVVVLEVRLVQ